jgi:DNA-binding response OmpR family regulator
VVGVGTANGTGHDSWYEERLIVVREPTRSGRRRNPARTADRSPGPPRILLVVGDPSLVETIRLSLSPTNAEVRVAATADQAAAVVPDWPPDLLVVDVDLADGTILERLKSSGRQVGRLPIFGLTRRGDLRTKLATFAWDVDDVLVLPFSPDEFLARLVVILRRHGTARIAIEHTARVGDLEIDVEKRSAQIHGRELHLTPREYSLLYLLAAHAGQTLYRLDLRDVIWGAEFAGTSNVVDQIVGQLRLKLGDDPRHPRYIATVAGRGYAFVRPAG